MNKFLMAAAIAAISAIPAAAQQRIEIGILDCVVEGGTGFIVGSTKDLRCTFTPAENRPAEPYFGVVRKFGIDVGVTGATFIKWAVLAPAGAYAPGALAGDYVGVSAEATVGVGVGANALVGGSSKSFALQPLSVQAQEGLNLAIGFSAFELRSAI